jgi:uncharacterized protein (DUF1697 family)
MPTRRRMTTRQSSATKSYIALLRGINVGGENRLAMKDLMAVFEAAGCQAVRTFIQSGNVIFRAAPRFATGLPAVISRRIASRFGLRVPVVLRAAADMTRVVRNNPFIDAKSDADVLHVLFLADAPTRARVAALDPDRSPGDAFAVHGREVYLQLSRGVARTRLTNAYFDSTLGRIGTLRTWRTVLTLRELAAATGVKPNAR